MADLVICALPPTLAPDQTLLDQEVEGSVINPELVLDLPFFQKEPPALFAIEQAVFAEFLDVLARRVPQLVLQSLQGFLIEILQDLAEVLSVFEIGEREDRQALALSAFVVGESTLLDGRAVGV